jgi:hypothetical protein
MIAAYQALPATRLDVSVGLKMCGTGPARAAGAEACEVSVGMACECFTKVSHEKA